MEDDEIRLEEYRQIREEIRTYIDRKNQNLNFSIAITIGVLSFGYKDNQYILFLSAALLIAFLWFDEIRVLKAIFRAATYIELFIEKRFRVLKWETIGGKFPIQTSIASRTIGNAIFPLLYCVNAVLGIIFFNSNDAILKYVLAGFAGITFFILIVYSLITAKNGRNKEKENWENLKRSKKKKLST